MNFLVIGYGNTLRSDDGAGQILARKIAQWELPGVRSLAVHQLTPELAEIIAQADAVIFIDAIVTNLENPVSVQIKSVQIKKLEAEDQKTSFGHTCDPRSLLSFTQLLYGKVITAYWVLIPAVNFNFGEQLSSLTQRGIDNALKQVKRLIATTNT